MLILEGKVDVQAGKEHLKFTAGPFTHFGVAALLPGTY